MIYLTEKKTVMKIYIQFSRMDRQIRYLRRIGLKANNFFTKCDGKFSMLELQGIVIVRMLRNVIVCM